MMKDFFKKLNKPQPEVEDLDTGYDSEYYAGAYDKADRRDDRRGEDRRSDDRFEERRPEDARFDDRRSSDTADRYGRDDGYYAPRGVYEEEDVRGIG